MPEIQIPVVEGSLYTLWIKIPVKTGRMMMAPNALVFGKINNSPPITSTVPTSGNNQPISPNAAYNFICASVSGGTGL